MYAAHVRALGVSGYKQGKAVVEEAGIRQNVMDDDEREDDQRPQILSFSSFFHASFYCFIV